MRPFIASAQVDEFAKTVRSDPKLAGGFDAVGLSQGGPVVRAYIEQYNDPPVRRYVAVCGVENGVYDCPATYKIIPFLCGLFEDDPYHFLFNGSIPLSFSDYFVTFWNQSEYLSQNTFLPDLNNELPGRSNATYTSNF